MSKKRRRAGKAEHLQHEISRIMTPRGNQTYAVVEQRLGGSE